MTARWSGAVLDRSAETPRNRGSVSKLDAGGFPTAPDGQSPEVVFQAGARDVKRRL